MNTPTTTCCRASLSLVTLAAALSFASTGAVAASMTRAEYSATKQKIEATYKTERAACKQQAGNARDICEDQAEGKQKVAKAELEANFTGKDADRRKVGEVKAKTDYEVAKERCEDKGGNPKDVCKAEAKAAYERAKADLKLTTESGKLRNDAIKSRNEASYKAEAEKCDALAGEAKSACVSTAKTRFGMN